MAINIHALYSQRLATSHIGDLPDTGSITVFDFGISSKLCPFGKNLSTYVSNNGGHLGWIWPSSRTIGSILEWSHQKTIPVIFGSYYWPNGF